MFKTLKNAWNIPELKKKLLFTLLIIVLYRLGANIPVPYVSPDIVEGMMAQNKGTILDFFNTLSGGALAQGTLFALGVSPYITASIVVQLLTVVFTKLQEWSKDEEGKKKINVMTRLITVALALITSIGYVGILERGNGYASWLSVEPKFFHYMVMVACFCAGAAMVMFLAEQINGSGIGNGISMILFANIVASAPSLIMSLWGNLTLNGSKLDVFGLCATIGQVLLLVAMLILIVWMSDAERRIPIQYAKRVVGRKMYGGQNTNLPIKVNMSGVMPIIFANSIVAILPTIAEFTAARTPKFTAFVRNYLGHTSWPYFFAFLILLIAFAFFYISISFNPVEVANNIKNNGGAIPGIRSGRPTVDFIKKVLNRITLVGALLVAVIACVPMLITDIASMKVIADGYYANYFSALAFGGSSMMIVVGVALETVRELEAQMSLRNYKGFLD